jgi:urease accessory protein
MTAMPLSPLFTAAKPVMGGWGASLQLQVARRGASTRMVAARHSGPLRLQRPFYPEGADHPHIYLLHPPGGMVPGDRIDIDITVDSDASALLTTPASGKVYDVGERALPQQQRVLASVAAGATLEWLPQDTLYFNGARFSGETTINLQGDANVLLWDVSTLGRRAGDHPFLEGEVEQRLSIYRDGKPLLLERMTLNAASPLLDAKCGLGGARTWGTLVATGSVGKELLEDLREACDGFASARVSVSALKPLLVARYLGDCPLQAMRFFERIWSLLRPVMLGREACPPRVWAT